MDYAGGVGAPAERVTFFEEVFDARGFGRAHSQKFGLHIEMAVKLEVRFVDEDGSASGLMEEGEAADVVNVGVSADDGADV